MKEMISICKVSNGFLVVEDINLDTETSIFYKTKEEALSFVSKVLTSSEHKAQTTLPLPKKEILYKGQPIKKEFTKEQLEEREKKNQSILKYKGKINEKTKVLYTFKEVAEELKKENIEVTAKNIQWVFTRLK